MNPRTAFLKYLPSPRGAAGLQRTPASIEHEHPLLGRCRNNPASGTTIGLPLMVRDATRQGGLPSTMLHTSYHHACGVRAPFRPYPRVVCRHRFKSLEAEEAPQGWSAHLCTT